MSCKFKVLGILTCLTNLRYRATGLAKFEVIGGLVSGTEESRGRISLDRPNRQWDFPYVYFVCFVSSS